MEVNAASFPHHLLGLFIHISEAEFVSLDLELSGIPSRLPNKPPRRLGRYTLEERYLETKEAADRYQILQVGITCARFDYIDNHYVLRPYNINLSPLLDERLDFERDISFQSGACSFLLSHGFDLGAPFATGVQYLSREEAERARRLAWDRLENKNPIQDLQLKDEDVESLDFLRRVRAAITTWKSSTSSSLEITSDTGFKDKPLVPTISRFEKRLVHQLVRAEFPDLVSTGRADCIRIIYFDPVREAENRRRIKNRIKEQIIRQTGFRWIFEALVQGGDVDGADPLSFTRNGNGFTTDSHDVKDRYDRAVERLRVKKPVLVGHNMFTDIVYFYRTFVGELPSTLQGFQDAFHKLFPKIIDTKYLATHAEGDLNASPTLQEIAEGLDKQSLPIIVTHNDYSKYQDTNAFHEAGYDSLLTATIMLRLATKLNSKRKSTTTPQSNGSSSVNTRFVSAKSNFSPVRQDWTGQPLTMPTVSGFDQREPEFEKVKSKKRRGGGNKKGNTSTQAADRRFHTKNVFDSLRELRLNPDKETATGCPGDYQNSNWEEQQPIAAAGSWEYEAFVQDTTDWMPIEQMQRDPMELIPAFDSEFWSEFGNTLRVFGTQEALLKVAEW